MENVSLSLLLPHPCCPGEVKSHSEVMNNGSELMLCASGRN